MRLKHTIKCLLPYLGLEYRWLAMPMFRHNVYSQNGEDSVIEFILQKLPQMPRFVIDIGANDGIVASNSRFLIQKYEFGGLLIEPFEEAFVKLEALYKNLPDVTLKQVAVGPVDQETGTMTWHGHFDNLPTRVRDVNAIFAEAHVPPEIGFLSIDIDGHENEVLQSVNWSQYWPWFVIAEIDSGSDTNLQTQMNIKDRAGYHPVLHIGNVFYIRKDVAGRFFFNWKTPTSGIFGLFRKTRL